MTKVVLDVPKIKQLRMHCFPASLAMIFQYYGYNNTQEEIARCFDYEVAEYGVSIGDGLSYIRAHGFIAHPRNNFGLEGIMRTIDKGFPLLAIVRSRIYGYGEGSGTHCVVVRGYETNPNIVWLNDPWVLTRNKMLYENFNREWKNVKKSWENLKKSSAHINQYGITIRESD